MNSDKSWRDYFFQDDFDTDVCLSRYNARSDLESIQSDLKQYGKELRERMYEILKTETEAIVNLAESLTKLNSKIHHLTGPLSQLTEEIKTLNDLIKLSNIEFTNKLEHHGKIDDKVAFLKIKYNILELAKNIENIQIVEHDYEENSISLERAVNKYSFEYTRLNTIPLDEKFDQVEMTLNKLTEMNNKIFLKAFENKNEQVLLRCLRMYENLQQVDKAEELIRNNILRPLLLKIFVRAMDSDIEDTRERYQQSLNILDDKLSIIFDIINKNKELKNFNIVLNCFWVEVEEQTKGHMSFVTAPGNPELFRVRYVYTKEYLKEIARRSGDENIIHTNPSFVDYLKRFNLAVYFEIRFQQIASKLELVAMKKPTVDSYSTTENDVNCKLEITLAFWNCVNKCLNSDIVIDELSDQFLKLYTLLISRYLTWFEKSLGIDGYSFSTSEEIDEFIVISCQDLRLVSKLISCNLLKENKMDQSIYKVFKEKLRLAIIKLVEVNIETILEMINKLINYLIVKKYEDCVKDLVNVTAIPRLYRKTNKTIPKEPSNYIVDAIEPVLKFDRKYKYNKEITDPVISKLTLKYTNLVQEVLQSVCKTEESLRRLKSRNVNPTEESNSNVEVISDEAKIREQIRLDVRYFYDNLHGIGGKDSEKLLNQLKNTSA